MTSLSRAQRSALLFVSASAYLAWYSGFGERLEAQGLVGAPAPSITLVPRVAPPHLSAFIIRDPFAGAPETTARGAGEEQSAAAMQSAARTVGQATTGGDATVVATVPDIVADRDASRANAPPMTLVVRATIVGRNPVAYVANGQMMDIVRVGDRLGDRRIATIDLRGIAFTDGSRLDLPGAFVPAPRSPSARASATAITIKLDDLRKLILRPSAQTPPLAPGAGASVGGASTATPIPAPTGTFPSPGPLPTIDPRGIPVGTNPTPNANGPTPYPNPYPYAPPAAQHR